MPRTLRAALLAVALVCLAVPTLASTIVLEPWTTPFQPNPCLETTHDPVIFTGPYCDGASCPPGTVRLGPCNGSDVSASDLLFSASFGSFVRGIGVQGEALSSIISPASQRMTCRTAEAPWWLLVINYPFSLPGGYDMPAHGVDEIQFEVVGSPGFDQPMWMTVFLFGETGQMQLTKSITQPGFVSLPLSEFQSATGYTGTDVIEVGFDIGSCPEGDCTGVPPATAGGFALGPISFHSTLPTPTKQRSWSQVKSIYR